jgi:hypothetical protein
VKAQGRASGSGDLLFERLGLRGLPLLVGHPRRVGACGRDLVFVLRERNRRAALGVAVRVEVADVDDALAVDVGDQASERDGLMPPSKNQTTRPTVGVMLAMVFPFTVELR